MTKKNIVFFLCFTLLLFFIAAFVAYVLRVNFYLAKPGDVKPWLIQYPIAGVMIATALVSLSLLALINIQRTGCLLLMLSLLILNHVLRIQENPFYNTFHQIGLLYLCCGFALLVNVSDKPQPISVFNFRLNKERILYYVFLLTRLFIGSILFFQGLSTFLKSGPTKFARVLYVEAYKDSFIPETLLWIAGIANPFVELIGGLFIIIGFKLRITSVVVIVFLLSIIFGHLIGDPYETDGALSSYGINNLAFVLVIYYYASWYNKLSVDQLLIKPISNPDSSNKFISANPAT